LLAFTLSIALHEVKYSTINSPTPHFTPLRYLLLDPFGHHPHKQALAYPVLVERNLPGVILTVGMFPYLFYK